MGAKAKKKPAGIYQRGRIWWIKYYRDGSRIVRA